MAFAVLRAALSIQDQLVTEHQCPPKKRSRSAAR
jgi:hypothetical protein